MERELQPFIQIDFLLKRNSAPTTGMLQPWGDNAMHSTAVYSAESPGIKTHTYLPSYTHNIFHLPPNTQALPPLVPTPICLSPFSSSYLHSLHLHLQAVTWLPQAGGGCQAANSGKPYMEDHPPLPNASPCKLANCLKLREPPKTVQRRGVCANWLKSSAGCSSITFHMREPSVLIKPPPASPPDFLFTCHATLFLPSLHTSRESLSCSRSIESQPCGKYSIDGRIESLYAICLISPCIGSLVRPDVHTHHTKGVSGWL